MSGFLVMFHTPMDAGYAMASLERTFFKVACDLVGNSEKVHFAFSDIDDNGSDNFPDDFKNFLIIDKANKNNNKDIVEYIKSNNITAALCFDLQPNSHLCKIFRKAGIKKIFSYWGSPISGKNSGLKLFIKKLENFLNFSKPDLFIFESRAMEEYAVFGRGISPKKTCVIPTGVDVDRFSPERRRRKYLKEQFNINQNSKVAFYSGHMESRKGVHVIVNSAIELVDKRNNKDWVFIICGNRPGEENVFLDMLKGKDAVNHVIFAGYRTDLHEIMPACDLGIVASTGWDSFPMSCLEMASCGLPLVVSNLQGLVETIEDGVTGFLFEPGSECEMADCIERFGRNNKLAAEFSISARERILSGYTLLHQRERLKSRIENTMDYGKE